MQPENLLPCYTEACNLYTEPDESIGHLSVLLFFMFHFKMTLKFSVCCETLVFIASGGPQLVRIFIQMNPFHI